MLELGDLAWRTEGTAAHLSLRTVEPATMDAWLALREYESAVCLECGRPGSAVNDVFTCGEHRPHVQWRWPGVVGLD